MNGRQRIRHLFLIPVAVMLALDVGFAIILVVRFVGRDSSRMHERAVLQREVKDLQQQVRPLHGLDQKIAAAGEQVNHFYQERFPDHYSDISEELNRLAKDQGIQVSNITYEQFEAVPPEGKTLAPGTSLTPDTQPLHIRSGITGDYVKLVKFINALERDKLLFIVDRLSLSSQSSTQNQGQVSLQLSLITYLRKA